MRSADSMQCYAARSNARQWFLASFWRLAAKLPPLPAKRVPLNRFDLTGSGGKHSKECSIVQKVGRQGYTPPSNFSTVTFFLALNSSAQPRDIGSQGHIGIGR
jgi:hypothetical protein